jgi:hypothetical protein
LPKKRRHQLIVPWSDKAKEAFAQLAESLGINMAELARRILEDTLACVTEPDKHAAIKIVPSYSTGARDPELIKWAIEMHARRERLARPNQTKGGGSKRARNRKIAC